MAKGIQKHTPHPRRVHAGWVGGLDVELSSRKLGAGWRLHNALGAAGREVDWYVGLDGLVILSVLSGLTLQCVRFWWYCRQS